MDISDLGECQTYYSMKDGLTHIHFPKYSQLGFALSGWDMSKSADPFESVRRKLASDEAQNQCFMRSIER